MYINHLRKCERLPNVDNIATSSQTCSFNRIGNQEYHVTLANRY